MKITLPADQERWLDARVADGEFASREAAIRQMIAERMALEPDAFAWARPDVNEGRAAIARRQHSLPEKAIADIDAVIASLKG